MYQATMAWNYSHHTINTLFGVINTPRDESGTVLPPAFPHLRDRVL